MGLLSSAAGMNSSALLNGLVYTVLSPIGGSGSIIRSHCYDVDLKASSPSALKERYHGEPT